MYIILKKQNGNVDEIINMFYGDENNETTINNWKTKEQSSGASFLSIY